MTFRSIFFMLAEKSGLLTKIGIIVHPVISLLVLLPSFYSFLSLNSNSGVTTVGSIFLVANVLQYIGQNLTAYHLYRNYLKSIISEGLIEAKFLYLMIPAIVLPLTYIIFNGTYSLLIMNSAFFTVAFCIGSLFQVLPSILSMLVVGVSCSYLRMKTESTLIYGIHEDKVTELVRTFQTMRDKASPHLFVLYTITTLQSILLMYSTLIMNSCFNLPLVYF